MQAGYRTRGRNRRGKKPDFNPMRDSAKSLADELYHRAKEIADTIAPERPQDTEEADDKDVWILLERVSLRLSPEFWDDPDAIDDLIRLRSKFEPRIPVEHLKPIARAVRKSRAALPDVSVTPASPEYEKMVERLKRGGR